MLTKAIIGAGLVSLTACVHCGAQTPDGESCRRFVQTFYDAYLKDDVRSANYRTEIDKHPNYFSDELRTGLKRLARRRDVGIMDFDPFLNAQDWDVPYLVDSSNARDMHCNAAIHSGAGADFVKVNAELTFFDGSWRFTDFIFPGGVKPNRLTVLLKKDAAR